MGFLKKAVVISSLCLLPMSAGFAYEQKAIYDKPDGSNIGARTTFSYKDDSLFHVNTKPGFVTDIQLRRGEELTYVAGGDTKSWLIDKAMVGDVQHVYIKPLDPGKHTNIIINTDMHTYRFDVWSSMDEDYDPLITFFFKEDADRGANKNEFGNKFFKNKYLDKTYGNHFRMNRDYEIKAKKQERFAELIPKEIMDDGQRTYIRVPDTNKYDMPVLYMINPWDKKKSLINYRVQNGYFVADVVMEHGVLMFHQKYSIDFYNRRKGGYSKSLRARIEEEMQDNSWRGFSDNREEIVRDVNPVEEEVYTMPPDAEPIQVREVKERHVQKEKPVKPQIKKEQVSKNVVKQKEKPVQKPVKQVQRPVVREQRQVPVVVSEPVYVQQQPVQPQRQYVPSGNYPGAGVVAEYVAKEAGLGK